ncbi:hypothetical protein Prum_069770 [Phytohabitans rumicis]|uniref:Uncharacterized protein n=1 Tax=Phytohabitans rumicis TaxID=1076125 RepID=A0A6V8LL19_9ACTN|nr:hypothetical protein Prum_069770 [Phytohabitans rumicis]
MPTSPARNRTTRPRNALEATGDVDHVGVDLFDLVADFPVGGEVVLAAQPVVPDPGAMWDGGIEPGRQVRAPGATGHRVPQLAASGIDGDMGLIIVPAPS